MKGLSRHEQTIAKSYRKQKMTRTAMRINEKSTYRHYTAEGRLQMPVSEKTIENRIKRYLDSIGAWYLKVHGSAYQRSGVPDIIACVNGKFVGIEVKKPGGVISALQQANIRLIEQSGGIAFVAYSLEEAKRHFKKLNLI